MPQLPANGKRSRYRRCALTLVESLVCVILVGGLLVAALETLGATAMGRAQVVRSGCGELLGQALMAEIMAQPYEDPDGNPVFGLEGGENSSNRLAFDDVDDYSDWDRPDPQQKDGTAVAGYAGWTRRVAVVWVASADLATPSITRTDIKRVTVDVLFNGTLVTQLTALRTFGPPEAAGGPVLLMVVGDEASLTAQEAARKTLLESWGYTVNVIGDGKAQSKFDTALADAVVAYVPEEVDAIKLGTKLTYATVGVINEDPELTDELGFSSDRTIVSRQAIKVTDNTHYITSTFSIGMLTFASSTQTVFALGGFAGSGLQMLAYTNTTGPNYYPSLCFIETGGIMYGGIPAPARRVQLPWGGDDFDFTTLNADGQTILKRAIEWAGNMEQP